MTSEASFYFIYLFFDTFPPHTRPWLQAAIHLLSRLSFLGFLKWTEPYNMFFFFLLCPLCGMFLWGREDLSHGSCVEVGGWLRHQSIPTSLFKTDSPLSAVVCPRSAGPEASAASLISTSRLTMHRLPDFLCGFWGFWTQIFMLVQQTLLPTEPSPQPTAVSFIIALPFYHCVASYGWYSMSTYLLIVFRVWSLQVWLYDHSSSTLGVGKWSSSSWINICKWDVWVIKS